MLTTISILIFIACCLLVLAVLIQNPKGGGLASGFQAGSQVMGVRRTADFLEKATWGLASAIIVLSIAATVLGKGATPADGMSTETSTTKEKAGEMNNTPATTPLQGTPAPAPAPGAGAPPAGN
jgi:preprotein translocase subunit SecG